MKTALELEKRYNCVRFSFCCYLFSLAFTSLHHLTVFGPIQVHFSVLVFILTFIAWTHRDRDIVGKTIFKANTLSSALIACCHAWAPRWVWMCARMNQPPPSHERVYLITRFVELRDARPLNMTTILHFAVHTKRRTKKTQRDLCLFLTLASLYVSLFHSFRIYSRIDLNSYWM